MTTITCPACRQDFQIPSIADAEEINWGERDPILCIHCTFETMNAITYWEDLEIEKDHKTFDDKAQSSYRGVNTP